ncbi:hypothetical protein AAHA92_09022 [Salvia divinorum]|uniref:MADF domain-containing protein n=1 Tax=Salvia divinorum TaxID=28513 RepID=A0ABD1HQ47_SALDI
MEPNQFPNPNSPNSGLPMFDGGGRGARWPGQDDYWVDTPGSAGSAQFSTPEFDPFFNTDNYRVDKVEPSRGQPASTQPGPPAKPARMKRMARKDKGPAVPLPADEVNNEYALKITDYVDAEYTALVQCWIDISEDPIYSNNQTMSRLWNRIKERYNEFKPHWPYKRNKEQLRKCWELLRTSVNYFWDIYVRMRDSRASGESMDERSRLGRASVRLIKRLKPQADRLEKRQLTSWEKQLGQAGSRTWLRCRSGHPLGTNRSRQQKFINSSTRNTMD